MAGKVRSALCVSVRKATPMMVHDPFWVWRSSLCGLSYRTWANDWAGKKQTKATNGFQCLLDPSIFETWS